MDLENQNCHVRHPEALSSTLLPASGAYPERKSCRLSALGSLSDTGRHDGIRARPEFVLEPFQNRRSTETHKGSAKAFAGTYSPFGESDCCVRRSLPSPEGHCSLGQPLDAMSSQPVLS